MCVLSASRPHLGQIVGEGGLEAVVGIRPAHPHGAEVADVEDDGVTSTVTVLGDGAPSVGQGHLPPAESDEFRPECTVDIDQGGVPETFVDAGVGR